jgi:hypothetical protein
LGLSVSFDISANFDASSSDILTDIAVLIHHLQCILM